MREPSYDYSQFLDDWDSITKPTLRQQADHLLLHADLLRIPTPEAAARRQREWRELMSYRHVFS